MQHISNAFPDLQNNPYSGGGRVSSPKLRQSLSEAESFGGLENDIHRYDLLMLVKRVGEAGGFKPRMIDLLEYYMAFTRDQDWEEGSHPIVYQSLSRTAFDLGISERQVQRLEKELFEVGALTWQDSGNHRRYGQRCPDTGEILFACGVDLSPLASIEARLRKTLAEKQALSRAWHDTKRQISIRRRRIRSMLAELAQIKACDDPARFLSESEAAELRVQIRTHMGLEKLLGILDRHEALLKSVERRVQEAAPSRGGGIKNMNMSFMSAANVAYFKYTNTPPFLEKNTSKAPLACFQGTQVVKRTASGRISSGGEVQEAQSSDRRIVDTGVQHISLSHALSAASGRFTDHLPIASAPVNWPDMINAAHGLCRDLGISQQSWGRACITMGRTAAAICVLLTDHAVQRIHDPVRNPAGYFGAMVNRAAHGELHLHKSIFGLLSLPKAA